jgi:hypothetical protein
MTETTPRRDGHVNHGGPILDRHDYRDWVEWQVEHGSIPAGTRVRQEFVSGTDAPSRTYVHPDDVPTDPDAELVERVARHGDREVTEYGRVIARGVIALVREHDKADR